MIVLPKESFLFDYRSVRTVSGQLLTIVVLAMRHAREEAVDYANLTWKQSQYEGAIPLISSPHPFPYFWTPRVRPIDIYQLCFTLPELHLVSASTYLTLDPNDYHREGVDMLCSGRLSSADLDCNNVATKKPGCLWRTQRRPHNFRRIIETLYMCAVGAGWFVSLQIASSPNIC